MSFSSTEVALEGFRLIGRRPVSALAWALTWALLGYGVLWALTGALMPHLASGAVIPDFRTDPRAAMASLLHLWLGLATALSPWMLWAWILQTVLVAAVYRAVIEPKNSGFAYLRLGGDELRLLLLTVIFGVLSVVFCVALFAVGAGLFIATRQLVQPAQGLVDAAGVIILVCLAIYVPVRLALAAPMTFARKRLQIFDSWALTGGRFWKLVGIYILVSIFAAVVATILNAVRTLLTAGPMQGLMVEMYRPQADPGRMLVLMLQTISQMHSNPLLIAALAVQGFSDTIIRIVAAAPIAAAYRALAADGHSGH